MAEIFQAVVALENVAVLATVSTISQLLVLAIIAEAGCDAKVWDMFKDGAMLVFSNFQILSCFKIETDENLNLKRKERKLL